MRAHGRHELVHLGQPQVVLIVRARHLLGQRVREVRKEQVERDKRPRQERKELVGRRAARAVRTLRHGLCKVQPVVRVAVAVPALVGEAEVGIVLKAPQRQAVVLAVARDLVHERLHAVVERRLGLARALRVEGRGGGVDRAKELRKEPLLRHDAVLDPDRGLRDRLVVHRHVAAAQHLERVQTRTDIAVRQLTQERQAACIRLELLAGADLREAPRNRRRGGAVEAQDPRKRAQGAQRRRVQIVAYTHNRPQDRRRRFSLLADVRAAVPAAVAFAALNQAHERADKARRAEALAAGRSVDLVNDDHRRLAGAPQTIRLERHTHARLDIAGRARIARIQLIDSVAGLLGNDMRQRRLAQAGGARDKEHALVRTLVRVRRTLLLFVVEALARGRALAAKDTGVPLFQPPQRVAVHAVVAQELGKLAGAVLFDPHHRRRGAGTHARPLGQRLARPLHQALEWLGEEFTRRRRLRNRGLR